MWAAFLVIAISGCMNSPDFERLRDTTKSETILWKWFNEQTSVVLLDDLGGWPSIEPCQLTIDSFDFQLNEDDSEVAFRSACARWEAIANKYPEVWLRSNDEWNLTKEAGCCSNLAYLLMWDDFSSEMQDTRDTLRDELLCGLGKEYYYEGEHHCRQRDSAPILVPTFAEATSAVELFLSDSAKWHATRCESQSCGEEDAVKNRGHEQLINHALSLGRFEQLENTYTRRGEWRVLLIVEWPESGRTFAECFSVLNEPGKYMRSREIIDAGYPRVVHCGGFGRLDNGHWWKTDGNLYPLEMSD